MTHATYTFTYDGNGICLDGIPCEFRVNWERVGEHGRPDEWEASATLTDLPFGVTSMSRDECIKYFGLEAVTDAEASAGQHFTEAGIHEIAAE